MSTNTTSGSTITITTNGISSDSLLYTTDGTSYPISVPASVGLHSYTPKDPLKDMANQLLTAIESDPELLQRFVGLLTKSVHDE